MEDEDLLESVNKVIENSKYYFYDNDFEKHIDTVFKLKKKLEKGDTSKLFKKEDKQ